LDGIANIYLIRFGLGLFSFFLFFIVCV